MGTADKPEGIVILGCPRSGTTLLRRLLDGHPDITAPGETYLLTSAARFLEGETMVDNMEVGVLNGLGFLGFEPDEVVSRLREFVFEFRRENAKREGKRRWAEKTAVDAFHTDAITRLCGDRVHYLCVVRHGLDVVCSMQDWTAKSQAYPAELHRYIRETPRPLEAFARAWADATRAITDFAGANPDRATLLRYEDLVSDTETQLARIFGFLGEDFDPDNIGAALSTREAKGFSDWRSFARSAVDDASVGRWKSAISRETAASLAALVNPVLEAHGYDPVPATSDRDDAEKRRRYEMGLSLQRLK